MQRWRGKHGFDNLLVRPYPHLSIPMIAMMDISKWHRFEDDFYRLTVDADFWTLTEDAGKTGTDVINDEDGGWFKNFCDGDDNDESYRISHGQSWKFQTDKLLYLETSIQLTEAATDDANWIVGLSDSAGANMLLDDGAGPAASYDGAVFFKVDGTLQVQFETSNAGTQVTTATGLTAFVSGTTYKLAFLYDYKDGTTASVTPFIDGVAGTAHSLTISGLEEMNLFFGVKAGGANEEAIEIDYIRVFAER